MEIFVEFDDEEYNGFNLETVVRVWLMMKGDDELPSPITDHLFQSTYTNTNAIVTLLLNTESATHLKTAVQILI